MADGMPTATAQPVTLTEDAEQMLRSRGASRGRPALAAGRRISLLDAYPAVKDLGFRDCFRADLPSFPPPSCLRRRT